MALVVLFNSLQLQCTSLIQSRLQCTSCNTGQQGRKSRPRLSFTHNITCGPIDLVDGSKRRSGCKRATFHVMLWDRKLNPQGKRGSQRVCRNRVTSSSIHEVTANDFCFHTLCLLTLFNFRREQSSLQSQRDAETETELDFWLRLPAGSGLARLVPLSSLGLLGLKRSTQTSGHKSLVCVETSFQPTERGQVKQESWKGRTKPRLGTGGLDVLKSSVLASAAQDLNFTS